MLIFIRFILARSPVGKLSKAFVPLCQGAALYFATITVLVNLDNGYVSILQALRHRNRYCHDAASKVCDLLLACE